MSNKTKSVLIVDDESTNILALAAVLIPKGCSCTSALNGEQCMRILQQRPQLDVILMDIMMPQMDGVETIKLIRSIPEYARTKIIVVTADDSPTMRLRCMAAGANGFVAKPVDADLLVSFF